jgi:hypothetical protein
MKSFSKKYNEIQSQIPCLAILSNEIIEGIRKTNADDRPLKVEFLIDEDFENPSWKQISIEVHTSEELEYEQAIIFWKRLEDEIRPRIKEVIRNYSSEFRTSPIEISNKNIFLGFNW